MIDCLVVIILFPQIIMTPSILLKHLVKKINYLSSLDYLKLKENLISKKNNLKIGKGATILGKSGPISDVKENDIIFGVPGVNSKQRFRELIIQRKLPDILKKLNLE